MQTEYLTLAADFQVHGRFAYLSHQETLSFWQRTLVRANVPLLYSQGFNPRPRLSLPLPRSVGVQSDCERLCARVAAEGFDAGAVRTAVSALLPDGCRLSAVCACPGKSVCYPISVTYRFTLKAAPDAAQQMHLERCRRQLDGGEPVLLSRQMDKGRQRLIDVRPFLVRLSPDGAILHVVCAVGNQGTARIDELLQWLTLTPDDLAEPVRRIAVEWTLMTSPPQGEEYLS